MNERDLDRTRLLWDHIAKADQAADIDQAAESARHARLRLANTRNDTNMALSLVNGCVERDVPIEVLMHLRVAAQALRAALAQTLKAESDLATPPGGER